MPLLFVAYLRAVENTQDYVSVHVLSFFLIPHVYIRA